MTKEQVQKLINQGEGLTIEFKNASNGLPKSMFETMCAFLNKSGGYILLGVNDDRTIEGLDMYSAESYCKEIATLSNNPNKLSPCFLVDTEVVEIQDKNIVVVYVPISSQVHKLNGKIFDRSFEGDFEVKTDDSIKDIYFRKSNYYSENTVYPYLYESDFVPNIVSRVRTLIRNIRPDHPWNDLSDTEFYNVAGLYRRDINRNVEGFTMTALLLFGKDEIIQSALPQYRTELLVRVHDLDRYDDRLTVKCNLIDAYSQILGFVMKYLPDKFFLEGDLRISLREKIFREIITNMLIHREFTNGSMSSLIIYRDRIETKNPNKPHHFGDLVPGEFEPFPKNPNIAQIFTQIGRAETLGTGVRNVYKYSKAYSGNDFISICEDDTFRTIVPIPNYAPANLFAKNHVNCAKENLPVNLPVNLPANLPVNLPANLPVIDKEIIKLIIEDNRTTYDSLSKKLNKTRETIRVHLHTLVSKGIITRVGADKNGYWKVNL